MSDLTTDEALSPRLRQDVFNRLAEKRSAILWVGITFTLLGLTALLFPVISSLVTAAMLGWLFILAGGVFLLNAFTYQGTGALFGVLTGLLSIAAGIYMIVNPGITVLVMTIIVAAIFLVEGVFQAVTVFEIIPSKGWGWLLTSALISVLVGGLILAGLPEASMVVLGILVGLNFLSSGVAMIMLARRLPDRRLWRVDYHGEERFPGQGK